MSNSPPMPPTSPQGGLHRVASHHPMMTNFGEGITAEPGADTSNLTMTKHERSSKRIGIPVGVTFAFLCGLGSIASLLSMGLAPGLAVAGGAVTFLINIAIFRTIVPLMISKLRSKQHSIYHATFRTKDGRYIKLKDRNENIIRVDKKRSKLITVFAFIFALIPAIAYTALIADTLKESLGTLLTKGVVTGMGYWGFAPITLILGTVALACNWAFYGIDGSEMFNRQDLWKSTKGMLRRFFCIDPDESLLIGNETRATVSDNQLRVRQFVRLLIMATICTFGFYSLFAVAGAGAGIAFSGISKFFLKMGLSFGGSFNLFFLKPLFAAITIMGSCVVFLTATHRASGFLARLAVPLWRTFVEPYRNASAGTAIFLTLTTYPLLRLVGLGFAKLFNFEINNALEAIDYTMKFAGKYEMKRHIPVASQLYDYVAIPIMSLCVWTGRFIINNLPLLAVWNAGNNGALAGRSDLRMNNDQFRDETYLAITGNTMWSTECYFNSGQQRKLVREGKADAEMDILSTDKVFHSGFNLGGDANSMTSSLVAHDYNSPATDHAPCVELDNPNEVRRFLLGRGVSV